MFKSILLVLSLLGNAAFYISSSHYDTELASAEDYCKSQGFAYMGLSLKSCVTYTEPPPNMTCVSTFNADPKTDHLLCFPKK